MFKPFLLQMQGNIQNPPPGMYNWLKFICIIYIFYHIICTCVMWIDYNSRTECCIQNIIVIDNNGRRSEHEIRHAWIERVWHNRNISMIQLRDFKNIWTKLKYVIIPRFEIHDNPEAVKELRNCTFVLK